MADADNNVIVAFANDKYGRVLSNWLVGLEKLGDFPVIVCALDQRTEQRMADQGVDVARVKASEDLSDLWLARVRVVHELVENGFHVLHTDTDAFWAKDPTSLVFGSTEDIVASQGSIHPKTVLAEWGHVLCFGFVYFRSTAASKWVLKKLLAAAETTAAFDDQRALNEALLESGVQWNVPDERYTLSIFETDFQCSKTPMQGVGQTSEGDPLTVRLLPHRLIQRIPNELETASERVVLHPYSEKTGAGTKEVLESEGAWLIG